MTGSVGSARNSCQGCGSPLDQAALFCPACGRPQAPAFAQQQAAWGQYVSPLGTVAVAAPRGWAVAFTGDELTTGSLSISDPAGRARYVKYPERAFRERPTGLAGRLTGSLADFDLTGLPARAYAPASEFTTTDGPAILGDPNVRVQVTGSSIRQGLPLNVGGRAEVANADLTGTLGGVPLRGRLTCETGRSAVVDRLWYADVWAWFSPAALWPRLGPVLGQIAASFRVDMARAMALVQNQMARSAAEAQAQQAMLLQQHAARMSALDAQALAIEERSTSGAGVGGSGGEEISGQGYLDALGGTQRTEDRLGYEYDVELGYDRYFLHGPTGSVVGVRYGEETPERLPGWEELSTK